MKRVHAEALADGLPHTLVEMESETFGDMRVEILVVTKTIADTLTCVEAEAPVKTEGDTVVPVQAYKDFYILKEVEANLLL